MKEKIAASELILNDDGSVYHLNLLPGDVADLIILVGDPERVPQVSKYFDKIEIIKHGRRPSFSRRRPLAEKRTCPADSPGRAGRYDSYH